jgi:hypothetical protein
LTVGGINEDVYGLALGVYEKIARNVPCRIAAKPIEKFKIPTVCM